MISFRSHVMAVNRVEERLRKVTALVRMKLTSFGDIDRVHIADMLEVGLITDVVRADLPHELRDRVQDVERELRAL